MIQRVWLFCVLASCNALASSNVGDTNKFAYSANVGWINARADFTNGAVIGEYVCSGYMYGANVGWINLGSGAPTNGIRYGNASAGDYGLNHDGIGNLRGYAYGANIGWINFESTGNPQIDLITGNLKGYAYGANIGWISLSNLYAFVRVDGMRCGVDGDFDGIPDAWELERVSSTNLLGGGASDYDGDGVPDMNEYVSNTDPDDSADYLHVINQAVSNATQVTLVWPSNPSRSYKIEAGAATTNNAAWADSGLGVILPDGTNTTRTVTEGSNAVRFYRLYSVIPYCP